MADRLATLEAERERDRIERREASLNLLLSQARIEAASADDFRRFYDADPDLCIRSYSAIPPNMQRLGVFGQDSGGNAAVEAAQAGEQFYANYAAATGVRGANVRDFSKAGGQS